MQIKQQPVGSYKFIKPRCKCNNYLKSPKIKEKLNKCSLTPFCSYLRKTLQKDSCKKRSRVCSYINFLDNSHSSPTVPLPIFLLIPIFFFCVNEKKRFLWGDSLGDHCLAWAASVDTRMTQPTCACTLCLASLANSFQLKTNVRVLLSSW